MKEALFLYGATDLGSAEFSADILWRTGGFKAPDPICFFEIEGKKILLASALEAGRAQKEAKVDEIILNDNISPIVLFLKERGIGRVLISATLNYELAKTLSEHFSLSVLKAPFYPKRAVKTEWEICEIEKAQGAVERAVALALNWLSLTKIKGEFLYHPEFPKTPASAGHLRKIIDEALFKEGYLGVGSIVAPGIEAADPHMKGKGPFRAGEPIVLDIYPRSLESLYFADMTRTVFRGEPLPPFKKMYNAVLRAQENAISMIKEGGDGSAIYNRVLEFFEKEGYPTNLSSRPVYGFIHGLGHGVGIEIHEPPRLGSVSQVLEAGNVVTVEPGLYYPEAREGIPAGGIRIEDMVLVTRDGARNLTRFKKSLEDMIVA